MQIEQWPIADVKPYPRNARKIPEKAVAKVAKSLAEFGWKQPVVVDTHGVVIVGHTRLAAAATLGHAKVPVLVAKDLTPAKVKAYRLMDNRSHDETSWDVRKGGKAHWRGDRSQSTLWSVPTLDGQSRTGHGTQKPVELMRRPILNHTVRGEAIYDPFLGSGTTLIAAQELERTCYGLEIDPKYCDVIVQRWQEFAGKSATLEENGRTFERVGKDRKVKQ